VGTIQAKVTYESQTAELSLVIVKGDGPTLLGRNWLERIKLNRGSIHYTLNPGLQDLLAKYGDVYQEGLGTLNGFEA
jgi:hypothetical protein